MRTWVSVAVAGLYGIGLWTALSHVPLPGGQVPLPNEGGATDATVLLILGVAEQPGLDLVCRTRLVANISGDVILLGSPEARDAAYAAFACENASES